MPRREHGIDCGRSEVRGAICTGCQSCLIPTLIFTCFTFPRQSFHIRQTPEILFFPEIQKMLSKCLSLTSYCFQTFMLWILDFLPGCQLGFFQSLVAVELATQKEAKWGKWQSITEARQLKKKKKKTCLISNSLCCSGSYAGQYINETPLELEMSKKLKNRRAAHKWGMNSRSMRASWGRGAYWDFNAAEINCSRLASSRYIHSDIASMGRAHCSSKDISHVLGLSSLFFH